MRRATASVVCAGYLGLSPVISATIHCLNVRATKIEKNSLKPLFCGSMSFKVIDVGKLVSSACYDTQQVGVYHNETKARS